VTGSTQFSTGRRRNACPFDRSDGDSVRALDSSGGWEVVSDLATAPRAHGPECNVGDLVARRFLLLLIAIEVWFGAFNHRRLLPVRAVTKRGVAMCGRQTTVELRLAREPNATRGAGQATFASDARDRRGRAMEFMFERVESSGG
jgi:hypothetical protein